jgi:uncharacterized alkaline shock family protein YloU
MAVGGKSGSTTIAPLAVARAVTAAALAVPGVVALDHGSVGEFATHGPGGRVRGVAVRGIGAEQRVAVRIVVDGRTPVVPIAEAVRDAVLAAVGDRPEGPPPVDVHVADVRDASPTDPVPDPSGPAPTVA